MTSNLNILAQSSDLDWTSLLYLLVIAVIPAMKWFGEKIQQASGKKSFADKPEKKEDHDFEVVIENGELVLKPRKERSSAARPQKPGPQPPGRPMQPPPRVRTAPTHPVAMPPPPARPRPPQAKPAPPPRVMPSAPPARPAPRPAARPPRPPQQKPGKPRQAPTAESDPWSSVAASVAHLKPLAPGTVEVEPVHTRDLEFNIDALRKAIVLNEILGPPIALRDPRKSQFQ